MMMHFSSLRDSSQFGGSLGGPFIVCYLESAREMEFLLSWAFLFLIFFGPHFLSHEGSIIPCDVHLKLVGTGPENPL